MTQWNRALAALALTCVLAGGVALARGPDMNLPILGAGPSSINPQNSYRPSFRGFGEPERVEPVRSYQDEPRKPKRSTGGGVAAFGYGKPVCVRLCDGSFFPTASVAGGDAACAAQCPDAPTALYTMSTDRIEDAVSSTGKPYTALPVAKRYQTTFENTCTCRRETVASRAKELLNDPTLRKGDVVMTTAGFQVYQGDGYGPNGPNDFVSLDRARNVSKAERATLTAMERASSGSPAPARPTLTAARPKGNVTVDNGPAN
jgi:hypothetical protein